MASLIKERRRNTRRKPEEAAVTTPKALFDAVCDVMGLSKPDVMGKCQNAQLTKVRAIYSYLGRELRFTCTALANEMNRDHSTVLFHHKTYTNYLDESKPWFREDLRDDILSIKRRLSTRLINCK
jgi:chromosomal replication initiation ATPase DnaA